MLTPRRAVYDICAVLRRHARVSLLRYYMSLDADMLRYYHFHAALRESCSLLRHAVYAAAAYLRHCRLMHCFCRCDTRHA